MGKMPRMQLVSLCYEANEGARRGCAKSGRFECICGYVDAYGERWHDISCPRCHGRGRYTRRLSRRDRHVIRVWNQQRRRWNECAHQSVCTNLGERYTRRMGWDENDKPIYHPRYRVASDIRRGEQHG